MPLTRTQLIIVGAVGLLVLLIVLVFTGVIPGLRDREAGQLSGTVNFWGVFDPPSVIRELIDSYVKLRPGVQVEYTRINPDTYESDLINALAGASGPDLFMFHNTWLPKHFDKVRPLTASQLSLKEFQSLFPTVVEQDFAPDGIIYALPLYLDTLALFYNKDYFDEKTIAFPPKNWSEFQNLIAKLREIDPTGKITRAAAAMGGSEKSINRATDILNLLMLQSGVPMVSDDFSRATFAAQGKDVLTFYTQFANPISPYFTWRETLPYSLDLFSEGKLAMMLNYSHQISFLKEKNPFLRFAVALVPQPTNSPRPITYANYWGLAASIKSPNSAAAWDFALYLTVNLDSQRQYLAKTGRPSALRALINEKLNDPVLGVFARQALTARSWPQIDNVAVGKAFSDMIANVVGGRQTAERAIQEAESKITQLMERKIR